MKNRRFIKIVYFMILILGTCCLWRINSLFELFNYLDDEQWYSETETVDQHYSIPLNVIDKKLPFHQIYETRQVKYPTDLQEQITSSNKTKVILLWTPWNGIKRTINYYSLQPGNRSFVKYKCPNQKCFATRNKKYLRTADAVLFHLLDTKSSDLPSYRSAQQLWILYNMEPPWLLKKHVYSELPYLKGVFNWTMSYRSNSDVVARYGFITMGSDSTSDMSFPKKTRDIVWFVSDCNTDSRREEYVKELRKYIDVDIYGTCGEYKCYPSQSATCYAQVLQKYKFYLSFENAICKDYVTEKFFNVFNYDIIPIVFGGVNYSSVLPKDTFIDATQYSDPKKLAIKLHEISNSEDLYRNILLKKRAFSAYLDPWMCRLCDKLHSNNNKPSILEDIEELWLKEAQCKTWNKAKKQYENSTLIVK